MTKRDLVLELARTRGMDPRDAGRVVDGLLRGIERALTEGESVRLRSFGTFEVRRRAARHVRVPGGSAAVDVPARLVPALRFSPGVVRRFATRSASPIGLGTSPRLAEAAARAASALRSVAGHHEL